MTTQTPSRMQGDGRFGSDVPRHVEEWVRQNLITAQEADAILSFERSAHATSRRIPLVAEAVGYLGAALAFAAGVTLLGPRYPDFARGVKLAMPVAVALALLATGLPLRRNEEPAIRRFAGVLWLLSTGAVAWLLAEAVFDVDEPATSALLIVGVGTTAYALALYRWLRNTTTQIALFASVLVALFGIGNLATPSGGSTSQVWYGVSLWALGVAWAVGGWRGLVEPRGTALGLGAIASLYAPTITVQWSTDLGIWMGVATAVALLVASVGLRSTALLVVAGIGLFSYLLSAIMYYLADTLGAPIALFVSGLVLIAVAFVTARLKKVTAEPGAT
ncbi:MAG: DUF2157 domain-containing protein [Actinobacteria bacterium]|nr:DUF2157 domain-containing protein [Actinomycetota bacterium]